MEECYAVKVIHIADSLQDYIIKTRSIIFHQHWDSLSHIRGSMKFIHVGLKDFILQKISQKYILYFDMLKRQC